MHLTLLPDASACQRAQQAHRLLYDDCVPRDPGGPAAYALVADERRGGALAVLRHARDGDPVYIEALVVEDPAALDRLLGFFDRFLADVGRHTSGVQIGRGSVVHAPPGATRADVFARIAAHITGTT